MPVCPPVRRIFSDEPGSGTFHSLGALPKRKHDISARKYPVFYIPRHDDDDHSSSVDEHPSLLISTPLPNVPFPRSTSPPSSLSSSSSPSSPTSPRPQFSRGASAPILLSCGKPLKSSLKTSSSSPAVLTPPQAHQMHLRSRSEPSSPAVTPKNVHFPEKDYALATVRVFNRLARPAALSNPANGNGDETETEGEDAPSTRFPFPPIPPVSNYEIDPTQSTSVPSKFYPPANILLESLNISSPSFSSPSSTPKPMLTGSILVRNLAFEKLVAVRFTLDDWQTVSEVSAHYVESLSTLPSHILPSAPACSSGDTNPKRGKGWDRFTFTIRLEDYAHSLSTRTLWLAVRYHINSTCPEPGSAQYGPACEWWDNNRGTNYRVGFRPAIASPTFPRSRPRRETISAPIPSSRTQPQPPATFKEHALGLIIPSVLSSKEIQPVNDGDRRSISLRTGKLNLCNYAPPTVRITPSSSSPSPLPSSITNPELSSLTTLRTPSNEDTTSPASSTLSTPSVSPTITPRVIIGGQPATPTQPHDSSEKEDDVITSSRPGHIADWDWSAPSKPRMEELRRQHTNLVPDLGEDALSDSNSLYNAFVTQWCFAQEPSPCHNTYGDVGIMT